MTATKPTRSAKDRPIPFSGPMVRAILEGRKTQTRRAFNPQPAYDQRINVWQFSPSRKAWERGDYYDSKNQFPETWLQHCQYGAPGDHLWVRETFYIDNSDYIKGPLPKFRPEDLNDEDVFYRADGECCEQIPECACAEIEGKTPWRPWIFLPHWLSRITLEVISVRVERLQDISADDIAAEGILHALSSDNQTYAANCKAATERAEQIGKGFAWGVWANGWDALNAKRGFGWSVNPWVWVIEFKRVNQ